jgi:hypothetical protein
MIGLDLAPRLRQASLTSFPERGHVHAITRDPTSDYGMDLLGLHYQESR